MTKLTAPIRAGKTYKVRFENDIGSTGVVLVMAGWVPKHRKMVPKAKGMTIAPKGSAEIALKVPEFPSVRRLSITVSLDAGESGLLEVFQGGEAHTRKVVTKTMTFEMPVDP
jgi:hypothetical protein